MSGPVVNEEFGDQDDVFVGEGSAIEDLVFRLVLDELEKLTADVSLDLIVMMDVEGGTSDVRYLQHADFVELVPEDVGVTKLVVGFVTTVNDGVEVIEVEQQSKGFFSTARIIEHAVIGRIRRLITFEPLSEEVTEFSEEGSKLVSVESKSNRRDITFVSLRVDVVVEALIVNNDGPKFDVVHF